MERKNPPNYNLSYKLAKMKKISNPEIIHHKSKILNQRGFTIIEIVVSVGIFSIILLLIISFGLWMTYYGAKAKSDREAASNAERVMDIITYEIKHAKKIYTPTTTSNQLSLETKNYLPAGENHTFIDFFICGTSLCLKKESQDPIVITSKNIRVSSLSFLQALNGTRPSVQINLTINYEESSSTYDRAAISLTSTASPRTN